MKIYFAANQSEAEKSRIFSDRVIQTLNQAGVSVLSNLKRDNIFEFAEQDLARAEKTGELLFGKMNAVIIDGAVNFSESGYLIALALTYKKPVLYLLEKGDSLGANLTALMKNKAFARLLKVEFYNEKTLEKIIAGFIGSVETGEGGEEASIKFTLRITPKIERYLHWKTHNTKLAKADFLRALLEDLIAKDEDYQKHTEV